MVLANNLVELQAQINMRLPMVVESIMTKMLIELGNIIDEEVYSYPLNGEWQNRTGEFKESWDYSIPTMVGMMCESVLSQDAFGHYTPNHDRNMWSHGNWNSSLLGFDLLNDIINNGLSQSNFNFPAIEARPFWNVFKQWLDINADRLLKEACIENGLPVDMASIFYTVSG